MAIVTAAIFAFYWIWQDFFQPLIFVSNPKNRRLDNGSLHCSVRRCITKAP